MSSLMSSRLRNTLTLWTPVILWAGAIFYLSSLTATPGGGWFMEKVAPYLAHFVEYAVLYYLLYRATRKAGLSFLLAILYAFSDEFHQSFVPGRVPDIKDIVLDIAGMGVAWLAIRKSRCTV